MIKSLATLDRILVPVLRLGGEFKEDEYERRRLDVAEVIPRLSKHLHDLASTQIGAPPPDLPSNPNVVKFAYSTRWPGEYSKLSSGDKNLLLELFNDVLELGCTVNLMWVKPLNPRQTRSLGETARRQWLEEAYAADIKMEKVEKTLYEGWPSFVIKSYIDEAVVPFYSERDLGGFMGRNYGKFSGHARMLYYAGMLLGVRFDT